MSGSDTHADTIRAALMSPGMDAYEEEREPDAEALAALDALVADLEREREAAANIKRDYDDVFGQLLRSHGERDRERARADRAEAALTELRQQFSAAASLAHSSMIAAGDSATGKMFYNGRYHAFHDAILMQDVLSAGSGGRETTP